MSVEFSSPIVSSLNLGSQCPEVTLQMRCSRHVHCTAIVTVDLTSPRAMRSSLSRPSAQFVLEQSSPNRAGDAWLHQARETISNMLTTEFVLTLIRKRVDASVDCGDAEVPAWLIEDCFAQSEAAVRSATQRLTDARRSLAELEQHVDTLTKRAKVASDLLMKSKVSVKNRREELFARATGKWVIDTAAGNVSYAIKAKLGLGGGLFADVNQSNLVTVGEFFMKNNVVERVAFWTAHFSDADEAKATLITRFSPSDESR